MLPLLHLPHWKCAPRGQRGQEAGHPRGEHRGPPLSKCWPCPWCSGPSLPRSRLPSFSLPVVLGRWGKTPHAFQLNTASRVHGCAPPRTSAHFPVFPVPCSHLPHPGGHIALSLLGSQVCSWGNSQVISPPSTTPSSGWLGLDHSSATHQLCDNRALMGPL